MKTKLSLAVLLFCAVLLLPQAYSFAGINGDLITISKSNETLKIDVTGKTVIIEGSFNTMHLVGTCKELIIKGNGNSLNIESSVTVSVIGDSNVVSYLSDVAPVITDSGKKNNILQSTDVVKQTELAK